MAPSTSTQTPLSPPELSYLHSSLTLTPPIRTDSRSATQFRPLIAEPDILPGTNGSARICFADGTEAIVGVKAEVEKSPARENARREVREEMDGGGEEGGRGASEWVELTIEIPGYRDDDALPVFLAAMLNEALLATGDLPERLWINRRFHWKLYIDVSIRPPTPDLSTKLPFPTNPPTYRSFFFPPRSLTPSPSSPSPPTSPSCARASPASAPTRTKTRSSTTIGPLRCTCTRGLLREATTVRPSRCW